MKKFFLALYDKLMAIEDVKYVHKWNDQLRLIMTDGGAKSQMFQMAAVFIAFKTGDIQQLGEGRQLYIVDFDLHILDWQLDTGDGNFEQNLTVFDLKDKVYQAVQKFQPGILDETVPVGACVRISEQEDNNHNGVFHFIQTYRTTWIEELMTEPVNGIDAIDPMPVQIEVTTVKVQDGSVAYDPTAQYIAPNDAYISNAGKNYVIKTTTPNPAGAFDASYWTLIEPNIYNFTP